MSPDLYLLAAYPAALSMSGGLHVPVLDPMVRATQTEAGGRAMSARGDLETAIAIAAIRGRSNSENVARLLDAYRDEVAHELAEKIRLHKDEARGAVQATKVVDFCADLIDPESADGAGS